MKNDRENIEFRSDNAANPFLEQGAMGPGNDSHLSEAKIDAWLGNRPIAYEIRSFFDANNIPLPRNFELLNDHEIWVAFYSFGIYQKSNFKEAVRATFEVEYADSPPVTIFQLFPTTELDSWGGVGGDLQTEFQLSSSGDVSKASQPNQAETPLKGLLDNAKASLRVGANVSLSLNLKVLTLKLTAAGINNDYGLWEFRKKDTPLVGDQQLCHILLVEKGTDPIKSLKAKLRLSVDIGYFSFWTSRRTTKWFDVSINRPDTIKNSSPPKL
jgi:hypothetical protein